MAVFRLDHDFRAETLDPRIVVDLRGGDSGFERVTAGRACTGKVVLWFNLPHAYYGGMEFTVELTPQTNGMHRLFIDGLCMEFGFGGNRSAESFIMRDGSMGVRRLSPPFRAGERQVHVYHLNAPHFETVLAGATLLSCEDEKAPSVFSRPRLVVEGDYVLHCVRIRAETGEPKARFRAARPFAFHVAVDFPDDLAVGVPYTEGHFESMLDHFERWGITRVYWMDYGGRDGGWYEPRGRDHVEATFANVADPLAYVTAAAHRRGMECYALSKPFEMGFGLGRLFPEGSDEAAKYGKLPMLGGWTPVLNPEFRNHHDYLIQRNPETGAEDAVGRIVRTIKFYNHDASATGLDPAQVRVWVSNDNASYRKYNGPCAISERVERRRRPRYDHRGVHEDGPEREVRVLVLEGLNIPEPFLAVTTPASYGVGKLTNTLYALARLLDADGRAIPFTYGVEYNGEPGTKKDLSQTGIHFDSYPSRFAFHLVVQPDFIERYWSLDNSRGFLGMAKGKNRSPCGAPEPSIPEVRDIWMNRVRRCMRCGVDGVDFRIRNHNTLFEWLQYGYNPQVVEAFKERHGVDIRTESFDLGEWRRLRGEFYTRFLRQASEELHAAGKRCQAHISPAMEPEPSEWAMYNIHWDWRRWIEDGIIDEITNKEVPPHGGFFRAIRQLTDVRPLPVYDCPFLMIAASSRNWRSNVASWWDIARETGHSGVILYECAALLRATQDSEELIEVVPGFGDFIREYRKSRRVF